MYNRLVTPRILEALADTPVVALVGARQSGKTTLVRHLAATSFDATYMTLDEPAILSLARRDPKGLIASVKGSLILDEVQLAPELYAQIKTEGIPSSRSVRRSTPCL